jgi:hypothetical protein
MGARDEERSRAQGRAVADVERHALHPVEPRHEPGVAPGDETIQPHGHAAMRVTGKLERDAIRGGLSRSPRLMIE